MSFESYFKFSSYGLVTAAFLALVLTGEVDFLSISLYLVALVTCIWSDARGLHRFRLREWMWRLLAIGYVPFVFLDAAFLSQKIVALVHMTLFLSAAKLFQQKTDRDWVFLYLIGFFQILLAAGLTFNAVFVCALTAFIFFFVSTLAAFEIKRSRNEAMSSGEETIRREEPKSLTKPMYESGSQGSKDAGRRFNRVRYLFGASSTQLVAVAILTLPLFFLIPRSSAAGMSTGIDFQTLTGFSESVTLGDVSKLKTSSRVVMRITLDRNPGKWLRWRGIALDHYDGRSWSFGALNEHRTGTSVESGQLNGVLADRSFAREHLIDGVLHANGISEFGGEPSYPDGTSGGDSPGLRNWNTRNLLKQDIILEPLTGNALFASSKLIRIGGPLRLLSVSDTRAVSSEAHRHRIEYTALSDLSEAGEDELRADDSRYPDKIKRLYLQLPEGSRNAVPLDPRIRRLAHQIADGYKSSYDKAQAIERYLKTNYTYSLDVKPTEGDPLAEFLFDTKSGFCEYFATAMTVMLRTIGIPARIVNGFQMGEYNEISDFYTVREQDAHSWVEVCFPGNRAWVEFDPTPAAGINDYSKDGLAARFRKLIDSAEALWMDYVVTLDRNEQASIMIALQYRLRALRESVLTSYISFRYWLMNQVRSLLIDRRWTAAQLIGLMIELLGLVLALLGLYVLWSYRKTRGLPPMSRSPWWRRLFVLPSWRRKRDPIASAVLFYEHMLAIMSARGFVKLPDQTPLEFARANGGIMQVQHLTEIYNRVRFGGEKLDEGDRRTVSILLSQIKQVLRQRK